MRSAFEIQLRCSSLLLRLTVLLALFASYGLNVVAQTREDANAVKSLISRANEERPILIKLFGISDAEALAETTKANSPKSRIGQMLCSLRIFQLNKKEGSLAVLRALPKSDIEMEAFSEFTHNKDNITFLPIYSAYYRAAFESVAHHPEYLHSIFRLSVEFDTDDWADYDAFDWYCGELAKVRIAIPVQYDRALAKELLHDQKFLRTCGSGH